MSWWRRVSAVFRSRRLDRELDEEMGLHLELLEEQHRGRGLSAEEARLAARREFGGLTQHKELYRERRGMPLLEAIGQDLRYGARLLRRSPGFTAAAVISLALGIGANTAVFSILNALLLRPLPVDRAADLVALKKTNGPPYLRGFSYPIYREIAARADLAQGVLAASGARKARITSGSAGEIEFAHFEYVSANYFHLLGLRPAAGRLLAPDEELPEGAHPLAVISHDYWRARYAADPAVVGRRLNVDGKALTIIGVAPPRFHGLDPQSRIEVWVPIGMAGKQEVNSSRFNWLRLVARRKAGVPDARLAAAADAVYRRELAQKGSLNSPWRKIEVAMRVEADPAAAGISPLRDRFSEPLIILMALVGLLLATTCANVANLLLARGAARRREMALRLAIGAGRGRIVRQSITESLLLAGLGGALGLGLAALGSPALVQLLPGGDNTVPPDVGPDWNVLAFTALVSLAAALVSGLLPAWQATRVDPAPALKEGRAAGAPGRRFATGKALVLAQVAMSLVLLVGAGLFVRSLLGLRSLDTGFQPQNVLTFWLDLPRQYTPEQVHAVQRGLLDRLAGLPGVVAASSAFPGPFLAGRATSTAFVETPEGRREAYLDFQTATPAYFRTVGVPLLQGRVFDEHDKNAAVVNEAFVRQFFPKGGAVGRRLTLQGDSVIVGIVRDTLQQGLREAAPPIVYLPMITGGGVPGYSSMQVRAAMPADQLAEAVRRELRRIDPAVALTDPRTLAARIDESLMQERLVAALGACFGVLALALAGVGLYGVLAYAVSRRTSEIGIRMALGADAGRLSRSVLREALGVVGAGIAIGLPLAAAGSRITTTLLFGIRPTDPLTYAAAVGVLALAGALAAAIPARRAAAVNPIEALRGE